MLPHWAVGVLQRHVHRGRTNLRTLRTQTLISAGVILLLTSVLFVAVAGSGSAAFCGSCHAMRPYALAYASGAHDGAGCVSCHASSLADRISMPGRVLGGMVPRAISGADEVSGPALGMPDDGCNSCHGQDVEDIIDRNGIRVLHPTCARAATCADCHGDVPHGNAVRVRRAYTMESCTVCHQRDGATLECGVCHSEHTQRERLERGPWQVTHGAQWAQTHGLGSLTSCGVCHPSDYCVRCHGTALPHPIGFGQSHGDEAKRDLAVCEACHDTDTLCTPCHGVDMPHAEGFLKSHSAIATDVDDPVCSRCHDSQECIACHERHIHPGNAVKAPKAGE